MVNFEKFVLKNGLKVIVHEDHTTPFAILNTLYDVGARDESPDQTGFAHLFEHLMFAGSKNVKNFDEPLERAGGKSNAFTSNDITNYYDILPAQNLETAFWLESDRMLSLDISTKPLEVQRKVVCEEFKQHYINKPYGDVWHQICALAYKVHPYQWPTIGKELSHVENATLEDVRAFFNSHYLPNNAIMVVAGNVQTKEVKRLSEKWFSDIPSGNIPKRNLPKEPKQTSARKLELEREVPVNAIFKLFHTCKRNASEYYATDLLNDILSGGSASRLYRNLVKEKQIFSEISAFLTDSLDEGLFIIEGMLNDGISMQNAEQEINKELEVLLQKGISDDELTKVKNQSESAIVHNEINFQSNAENLAFFELLGDAALMNQETKKYLSVNKEEVNAVAKEILTSENCSTLYYHAKK